MKLFLKRLIVMIYIIVSLSILVTAIAYPMALTFEDAPPIWVCWIIYPIALVVIASQSQVLGWADGVMMSKSNES